MTKDDIDALLRARWGMREITERDLACVVVGMRAAAEYCNYQSSVAHAIKKEILEDADELEKS